MFSNRVALAILAVSLVLSVASVAADVKMDRPPIDESSTHFSGVISLNWTAGYCYAMKGTQN